MNILMIPLDAIGMTTVDEKIIALLDNIDIISESMRSSFDLTGIAMAIGLSLALIAGAYECFMMMMGKQVIDTMKLLRIMGISLCIANAGVIADMATAPGRALEEGVRKTSMETNTQISALEKEMETAHNDFNQRLNDAINKANNVEKSAEETRKALSEADSSTDSEDGSSFNPITSATSSLWEYIKGWIEKKTIMMEQKIAEWINAIIRIVGQLLFQISYIAMLLSQRIFIEILTIFAPIAFALSLAPPFKSAWSQWLGKILSLSLWGFLIYFIMNYVLCMQMYFMQQDIEAYSKLCYQSGDGVGAIGMQAIGTTCYLAIGWFIGVYILRFVPEVASWLIPGGVSSGAGASATMGMAAASAAGGAVGGAVGGAAGAVAGVSGGAAKALGAMKGGATMTEAVLAQTSVAQGMAQGKSNFDQIKNV